MAILSMLQDMNFINNYKIDCPTLARFCLMVKKGYRDPPYHNWMHAFSVSHFCYLLYKNLELSNYLEDIEIFALFISCMCHDLDHRGTNNSFQVASKSEKAYIPELQISFMEHIAMPIYKLLQDLFPKAAELYERVASNREHWTKVSHKFTIRGLPSNNSLDFLDEEYEVPDLDGTRAPVNGCCSLEG